MKKLSLFALVLTISMTSCSKMDMSLIDDIVSASKTTIDASELPADAVETLDDEYFETYIDEVLLADGLGYLVKLGNDFEVYFDKDGECLNGEGKGKFGKKSGHGKDKGEKVEIEDLPEVITTYITDNYPDVTIERAKMNRNDKYMVKVTGDLILSFDADGAFLGENVFMDRHGDKIELEDLPTAITDYVTANYSDATIKIAFQKEDRYMVGLSTDTGKTMLIFDSEGVFIEEKTCNG